MLNFRTIISLVIVFSFELFGQIKMKYEILPQPQSIEFINSPYHVAAQTPVFIDESSKEEAGYCVKELKKIGNKNNVKFFKVHDDKNAEVKLLIKKSLDFDCPENIADEAYKLSIDQNGVLIEALTYKGLFYGLQSFGQILEQSENRFISGVVVRDFPDLKIRGISDDISRGQVSTLKNFKKIIDFISSYKMNVYMPYIEDMLKFKSFPSIGKNRGALSKEEVKELVKYAKSKFVEIIPIFQTLGHYENILSQGKFLKYAEFPGAATLDVSDPAVYKFLEKLIKEVAELFPSAYFHMGADESFDVGLGKSKKLVEKYGIAKVHAEHYKKVYSILKKYHKKVMMYGDILLRHPEILQMIPKDIVIVDWHYRPAIDYPSVRKFKKAGFQTIVSPASWNFLTTYPTNLNALPNIEYFTKAGVKNSALGMINSNWGDYGAETFKELLYWDYAWSADCAWNVQKADISKFNSLFFKNFFGIKTDDALELNLWFANPLNQFLWHEVWRHPLLPLKKSVWWVPNVDPTAKLAWLKETLPVMENKIIELKNEATRNKDQIKIYNFLENLYSWYATKLETSIALQDTTVPVAEKKEKIIPLIDKNIASLKKLKKEFKTIWLKYYEPANLNMIEDKFDRLTEYFKETKEMLLQDTLYSPLIPSKWIYCNGSGNSQIREAYFSASFEIGKKIKSAKMQLLGDTYAELYLNGKFVTKVFARRTLSLFVEYGRVKYLNVKKFLRKGKNTIEVHAINYDRKGSAGTNVIGQIVFDDGSKLEIRSGRTWLCKENKKVSYKDEAIEKKYRYEVIAPNFETDRPSWIER